jgi:uncharacterized protein YlxW (UPF0749 family)
VSFKKKSWQIPLTITLLVLGFFISVQFKVQQDLAATLNLQKTEDLIVILRNLHDKKDNLSLEAEELTRQLNEINYSFSAEQTQYSNMTAEIQRLQVVLGLVEISGPGISVIIYRDSILLYRDIVDIINELWASGAEAIALNHHRIDFNTRIYDDIIASSLEIVVNDEVLLYPVIIQAIGNPDTLEAGLTFPGGIIDNFNILYHIYPEIRKETDIILPAVTKRHSSMDNLKIMD